MNVEEEVANLLAQAEAVRLVGDLTQTYDAAMAAFREDPSPQTKAAMRAAAVELSNAREQQRGGRKVILFSPNSAMVTPGGLSVSSVPGGDR